MPGKLFLVLGDQLDPAYLERVGLDKNRDHVLMAEVIAESTHVSSNAQRTVLFLSAMRHHERSLAAEGWRVRYVRMDELGNTHSLGGELTRAMDELAPDEVHVIQPGDHRVRAEIEAAVAEGGRQLTIHDDPHFLCTTGRFNAWATGRKSLTMEYFYRAERKRLNILMDDDGQPVGGAWNYDKDNRKSFKHEPTTPEPAWFEADHITRGVIELVKKYLPDLPGDPERFRWPVTREQALVVLDRFIEDRLPDFGDYQDAMWTNEHTLNHALLAPALNLKLLDPREVVGRAVDAYERGHAPLNAVEGFVRQVIGWREFIRGVYFYEGDDYPHRNALDQHGSLPEFYWTADTDMTCMRHALRSVIDLAYGHHIARLMVTGNFALIAGVHPRAIGDWYLAMYADAVDWVSAPNTIGMAMHADNAVVGTKPYAASGKYIQRMSNYCKHCRYSIKARSGDNACPFNVFYWDFLHRNRDRFKTNTRMALIFKSLERVSDDELVQITSSAAAYRDSFGVGSIDAD